MKKSQIAILIAGVLTIGVLYSLPRVVVDNESNNATLDGETQEGPKAVEDLHDTSISEESRQQLGILVARFGIEENKENFIILADSIAKLYSASGKFDSAAYYLGLAAERHPELLQWEKAGKAYYEAYSFAMNEQKQANLAESARNYLNRVLEKEPKRLDLKTKVAMTYVSSANPMQGITMLREILEEDPTNEEGLYHMGVLSMQSGQYKRAAERFEELVRYHPDNIQGQFYLAVSYFESKQNNKAKKQFQLVKDMTTDPMVLASVDGYLERI
jgi:outer membrane protein